MSSTRIRGVEAALYVERHSLERNSFLAEGRTCTDQIFWTPALNEWSELVWQSIVTMDEASQRGGPPSEVGA